MGNFLFIEPFYGGSHKYFSDALVKESRHNIDLYTLPARFWKWRMRGAAVYISEKINDFSEYDAIIASNMLSISDLKGLAGPELPPVLLYFHENQITYPLSQEEAEDLHYGFTDFTSALCADRIIFNSHYHKSVFIDGLKPFLNRFPDFRPESHEDHIKRKSDVLYPGVYLEKNCRISEEKPAEPVIIWNHRWEHDKNPDDFFEVLFQLQDENVPFKLAVLGESYQRTPEIFSIAKKRLKDRIIHFGYADDYKQYISILNSGDIIISTAIQENYGISVIEAIGAGNFPLLPDRLSYREIIPERFHKYCIYKNKKDLVKKMKKLISRFDPALLEEIVEQNKRFDWTCIKEEYNQFLDLYKKKSR